MWSPVARQHRRLAVRELRPGEEDEEEEEEEEEANLKCYEYIYSRIQ